MLGQNPSYPSRILGRSHFGYSFTTNLPYNKTYNNCNNTLCYTSSKNFIYKPHSVVGITGTTASSYLSRRKRV
jgi:hypothetical protein